MSIVIIGGNDRMVSKYTQLCKAKNCKAKVFTQPDGNLRSKIGTPDLMVLFTNTVCHKMVLTALKQAEKHGIKVMRSHSSSASALKNILDEVV